VAQSSLQHQEFAEFAAPFFYSGIIEAEFFDAETLSPRNTQPGSVDPGCGMNSNYELLALPRAEGTESDEALAWAVV
jgi:hypothetical protein